MILIFFFINNLLQSHDLKHCVAWIVLIIKNAQLSENVFFTLENTFSSSDNIARIEKISIVIKSIKESGFFMLGSATYQ